MTVDPYLRSVQAAESPDGSDNRMGSGAFTKFQFMPATAAGLAARTSWGRGLTPEQLKATLLADEGKAVELAKMFTQDNDGALTRAGLPANDGNRFALHRFGPAGGVSLLRADGAMPVADWVRSVNWGQGISPDAVIRQNNLGQYFNVGDLRSRFINGQIGGAISPRDELPEAKAPVLPATAPQATPRDPHRLCPADAVVRRHDRPVVHGRQAGAQEGHPRAGTPEARSAVRRRRELVAPRIAPRFLYVG